MVKNLVHLPLLIFILETSNFLQTKHITKFRALCIPIHEAPSILEDTFENIKKYLFYGIDTYLMTPDNEIYFIVANSKKYHFSEVNLFATTLYNSFYSNFSNKSFTIYGPALVVGFDEDEKQYISTSNYVLDSTLNLMNRYKYEI